MAYKNDKTGGWGGYLVVGRLLQVLYLNWLPISKRYHNKKPFDT